MGHCVACVGIYDMTKTIHPDQPVAGFYKMKQVRGGPWCPVRIWRDETAQINGHPIDIWHVWPGCSSHPIDEIAYRHMLKIYGHAVKHDPSLPAAAPTSKIDPLTVKPPIWKRHRKWL